MGWKYDHQTVLKKGVQDLGCWWLCGTKLSASSIEMPILSLICVTFMVSEEGFPPGQQPHALTRPAWTTAPSPCQQTQTQWLSQLFSRAGKFPEDRYVVWVWVKRTEEQDSGEQPRHVLYLLQ